MASLSKDDDRLAQKPEAITRKEDDSTLELNDEEASSTAKDPSSSSSVQANTGVALLPTTPQRPKRAAKPSMKRLAAAATAKEDSSTEKIIVNLPYAVRLYDLIQDGNYQDCFGWYQPPQPHHSKTEEHSCEYIRVVVQSEQAVLKALTSVGIRITKLASFRRRLQEYGFVRYNSKDGHEVQLWYHPLFRSGHREDAFLIQRPRRSSSSSKPRPKQKDEGTGTDTKLPSHTTSNDSSPSERPSMEDSNHEDENEDEDEGDDVQENSDEATLPITQERPKRAAKPSLKRLAASKGNDTGVEVVPSRKTPFLIKLYDLVNDGKYKDCLDWYSSSSAQDPINYSIIIKSKQGLLERALVSIGIHNSNMDSFYRRLNSYGFSRPRGLDISLCSHSLFQPGNREDVWRIQTRQTSRKNSHSQTKVTEQSDTAKVVGTWKEESSSQASESDSEDSDDIMVSDTDSKRSTNKGKRRLPYMVRLYELVEDTQHDDCIAWYGKDHIEIKSGERLLETLKSIGIKNTAIKTFQRHLRRYGFVRKANSDKNLWSHPLFRKGNEDKTILYTMKYSTEDTPTTGALKLDEESSAKDSHARSDSSTSDDLLSSDDSSIAESTSDASESLGATDDEGADVKVIEPCSQQGDMMGGIFDDAEDDPLPPEIFPQSQYAHTPAIPPPFPQHRLLMCDELLRIGMEIPMDIPLRSGPRPAKRRKRSAQPRKAAKAAVLSAGKENSEMRRPTKKVKATTKVKKASPVKPSKPIARSRSGRAVKSAMSSDYVEVGYLPKKSQSSKAGTNKASSKNSSKVAAKSDLGPSSSDVQGFDMEMFKQWIQEENTDSIPLPQLDDDKSVVVPKGVTIRRSRKWQAQVYFQGSSRYIGVFENQAKACRAYAVTHQLLKRSKTLRPKLTAKGGEDLLAAIRDYVMAF